MKIRFDTPPARADQAGDLSVRYAAAKRTVPRWRWRLVLLLLALTPAYFVIRALSSFFWETAPGLVVMQSTVVRAGVSGHVTFLAESGARLARGDVLARVQPANAATPAPPLSSAGVAPPLTGTPRMDERSAPLQQALRVAEQQRRLAQDRLKLMQSLRAQDAATEQEVQSARAAALQADSAWVRTRLDLAELQEQAHQNGLKVAPPPLSGASASSVNVTRKVQLVRMPFDGVVSAQQVAEGEWISASTDLAALLSTAAPMIHAYLAPSDIQYAAKGRHATLIFQDGGRLPAEVLGVTAEAERQPAESVSPLVPRNLSVVVRLRPVDPLPDRYRIFRLPLEVRFDRSWREQGSGWLRPLTG